MTPWVTGDVITADRLNGMMVFQVHLVAGDNGQRLDKTYGEIVEALENGCAISSVLIGQGYHSFERLSIRYNDPIQYQIYFNNAPWNFLAGTADEYPTEDLD